MFLVGPSIAPLHFWPWKVKGQRSRSRRRKSRKRQNRCFGRNSTANRPICFK